VSEQTAYHHGEVPLHQTIVGMAQDFVGSNNLPLLVPSGQFGTRHLGGKDAGTAHALCSRNSHFFFTKSPALFCWPDSECPLSVHPFGSAHPPHLQTRGTAFAQPHTMHSTELCSFKVCCTATP
jgi:hypothetical protein